MREFADIEFARKVFVFAVHAKRRGIGKGDLRGFDGNEGDGLSDLFFGKSEEKDAEEGEKHFDPAEKVILFRGFDRDELEFVRIIPIEFVEAGAEATARV